MKKILKKSPHLFAGLAALILNLILFFLLYALGGLFSEKTEEYAAEDSRVVLYEYKKPEQDPKTESTPKLHQISTAAPSADMNENIAMNFTPDLSVAGGSGVSLQQQNMDVLVLDENETDNPLVPLYTPGISYPRRAVDLGIEGTLEVMLLIETDGSVISVEIIKSPHPSISAAARDVIPTWRFQTATNKGIPVRVRAVQSIEFRLN